MEKNLFGLTAVGAFIFAAFSASADDLAYSGTWHALPGVSVMHADSDLEADPRSIGGFLKFCKEISEHWDVQVGLSHNRADNDFDSVSGKYRQTLFGVDALYFFNRDKFRPFLLAGVGAARNNVDYTSQASGADFGDKKTSWMADVGFGAQYLFNENFGLQADLRQVMSLAEYAGSNGVVDTHTIGNTYLNLGAIFRFGEPKPAPVVEPTPEPVAVAPEQAPEPALELAFEKVTLSS